MESSHITGMRGVYLVAAELSKLGFVVSPTSRGAFGADLLVTDKLCKRAYSVQVKTNTRTFTYWLLNPKSKKLKSPTHIYVLVNLRKDGKEIEYFVVPSKIVAKEMDVDKRAKSTWYSLYEDIAKKYQDNWSVFGSPEG